MGWVRTRLSAMMFLQYFVWGAWAVEIGGYMGGVLGFSGAQIGRVFQATAIAAIVSPLFMGYVADRLFSTEKVLALLHLLGAALLACAACSELLLEKVPEFENQYFVLRYVMIAYALCYMPTLALTNSISFENMRSPEKEFPIIRVFGTLGWIAAGLVVGFILKAAPGSSIHDAVTSVVPADSGFFRANNFLWLATGASAVLGLYCLTLPYTPPKRASVSPVAGERRSIVRLLSDPSFLIFTLASFLICIPLAFYYNLANLFLQETEAPYPTALQTVGQASEVFFMAAMPFFISLLGVKRMLAIGMLAWVLRYAFFSSMNFPLIVVGLVLHGICYDFFFVASQIYVDSKADVTQRASAQSFIAFITLGLGMFVGAEAAGWTADKYAPRSVQAVDSRGEPLRTPEGLERRVPFTAQLALPTPESDVLPAGDGVFVRSADIMQYRQRADSDEDGVVNPQEVASITADANGDGNLSPEEHDAALIHDWFHIWLWPALGAAATLLLFWVGFRYRPPATATIL